MNRNRRPGAGQISWSHRSRFADRRGTANSSPRRTCNSRRPSRSTCNDAIPTARSKPGNTATDPRFERPEARRRARTLRLNRRPWPIELSRRQRPDSRWNSRLHGY